MEPEEVKAAMKEAIKEWLDGKARDFGWWSLKTLAAVALAAVLYFVVWVQLKIGG